MIWEGSEDAVLDFGVLQMNDEMLSGVFDFGKLIFECCPAECQIDLLQQCCRSMHDVVEILRFATLSVLNPMRRLAFSIAVHRYSALAASIDSWFTTAGAVLVLRLRMHRAREHRVKL